MGKWQKESNGYIRVTSYEIVDAQIKNIWKILVSNASNYLITSMVAEDKYDKQKDEKSSDYVARLSNIQPQKKDASHYSSNTQPIDIVLPNGTSVKGIIRISDHLVNLNTWEKENPGYDFGISIVIGKETSVKKPTEPAKRIIHIFEYVLDDAYTEKVRILRSIADNICNIKKNGFKVAPTFSQIYGNDKTNGIAILESTIRRIVREELRKRLNENQKK